jgi:polyphosphate kinase
MSDPATASRKASDAAPADEGLAALLAADDPLTSPARFINRELSWLEFNVRVLEEAENARHPILERLRFLSISASNLDEFYMVRVAGLRAQMRNGLDRPGQDGLSPAQQLERINAAALELMDRQQDIWRDVLAEMDAQGPGCETTSSPTPCR